MNAELRPWLCSAGLVLAGFGLAGWLLLRQIPTSARPPPAQPLQAIALETAPRPIAPPAPPSQRAIGPRQQTHITGQHQPSPRTPPPLPPSRHTDAIAVPLRPLRTAVTDPAPAADSRPVAQTTAPMPMAATLSHTSAATADQAGLNAHMEADWQSLLLGRLQRYRRYPRQAERSHQQGVVWLRFAVNRQGRVIAASIQQMSGHRLLDQEALATLYRASPLPPPPPELAGDPVMVRLPVHFHLH